MRTLRFAFAALLLAGSAQAKSSKPPFFFAPLGFTDALWVGSIPNPTAHAWAPDGRMFVCEKGTDAGSKMGPARLRVIKEGSLLATPFCTVTVDMDGERGMLGVAVDPNFNSNHFVYIYYSNKSPSENRVSRFVANTAGGKPDESTGVETILKKVPIQGLYHNGGAIHFGPDGKLYVGVGDSHTSGAQSQDPNVMGGKILRINSDGSVPSDNPTSFQGGLTVSGGVPKEGWCCGLRNPFTFAFQPGTGLMYINDVGQDTWEEINQGGIGKNYGWQGGTTDGIRNNGSFTDPIHAYNHSGACALTGGTFYNPATATFPASYVGKYFFADYCGNWIKYLTPGTPPAGTSLASTMFTTTALSGPVDLSIGPDGALYYSAQNSGAIGRISYLPPGQGIVLSTSSLTFAEGSNGTFTVQLAAQPVSSVTVTVARSAGDSNITASPGTLTFTTGNWNSPQTVTVSSVAVPNGSNQTATITCSSGGLTSQNVSVTATDAGVSGAPTANISKPANGDVVGGATADFFGNGTAVAPATLAKADFYIDGALASTDKFDAGVGHFHFGGGHNKWDTTMLADGVHFVRMVVTDSNGMTGSDERVVVVANHSPYAQEAAGDHLVVIEGDRYSQRDGGVGAAAGHAWTGTTAFAGQSGSYALQAAPNDNLANINTGYAAASPRLDYIVNFATTGTHYVWVRGWGPDGSSDSCHVGLDGIEIATSDRITGFPASWTWSNQTMDGVVASFNVSVAGLHGISVWMREDGFVFDKLLLTTNAALAAPVGNGPAVSAGAPPVGGGGDGGGGGGACGFTGIEGVIVLGLAAAFRRRRR